MTRSPKWCSLPTAKGRFDGIGAGTASRDASTPPMTLDAAVTAPAAAPAPTSVPVAVPVPELLPLEPLGADTTPPPLAVLAAPPLPRLAPTATAVSTQTGSSTGGCGSRVIPNAASFCRSRKLPPSVTCGSGPSSAVVACTSARGARWVRGRNPGASASTAPLEQHDSQLKAEWCRGGSGCGSSEIGTGGTVGATDVLLPSAVAAASTGAHSIDVTGGVVRMTTLDSTDDR